ncbi:MAG: hypothetical protein J5863_09010 [Desulfovibrio sp.]|nr:hypothetical protein [Desulfovibrio sp.]
MKMLLIVFNVSIEDEVKALLAREGAACFTQWPRLLGVGQTAGARFDDNVWPGANGALFTVLEDEKARRLMAAVDAFRQGDARREGLKAFLLNVEAATGEL